MLLLFTLGMLLLSLWGFKNAVFPNLEKLSLARENFMTEANKDPNFVKFWAVAFLVVIILFAGLQSIYLGFAVNFLLAKGVLLAKAAAFTVSGLFLVGLLTIAHMISKLFKNVDDPSAFRDVILGFPKPLKQAYTFVIQTIWIAFYSTVVFFLLQ